MQETESRELDKFEIFLEEMIEKLQACQNEKGHKSCSTCEHFLSCELRSDYINAVYNSMSKGDTGGFEF